MLLTNRLTCREVIDVQEDTHVEERDWFVPGVGPFCLKCAMFRLNDLGSKLKQLRIMNVE